jgi:hypothetical protein
LQRRGLISHPFSIRYVSILEILRKYEKQGPGRGLSAIDPALIPVR